ncbi:MAG TPA: RNHCP domain-containing protein [Candidatus Limnocylindrales bacterium]|nr:RNHCP domain-containing protein [Candidatus Limnocylindrales bacterium]
MGRPPGRPWSYLRPNARRAHRCVPPTRSTQETSPLRQHRDPRRVRHRPRTEPSSFRCVNCRLDVPSDAPGTQHRNHCPACLWSRHVDDRPGDRAMLDECGSGMEPIAITVRGKGEWVLIHRCTGCGELHANRSAADDSPLLLVRLAVRPLALPPFPLDRLSLV